MSRRRVVLLTLLSFAGALAVASIIVAIVLSRPPEITAGTPSPSASTTPRNPTPSPIPTATPTTTQASTPTPRPTSESSTIVLGAEGFILDSADDSAAFTFAWSDDPTEAVAALTEAFGVEPNIGLQEGDGTHFPDYTLWRWSSFQLASMVEEPGSKSRTEYSAPAWVEFSSNFVGDVEIRAEFGLAIGTTVAEARAAGPDDEFPMSPGDELRLIFAEDRSISSSDHERRPRVSVIADGDADEPEGVIVVIRYARVSRL